MKDTELAAQHADLEDIPDETLQWMEEVGIQKSSKIMRYFAPKGSMMYSHEYLRDTPLESIKKRYGKHPADPPFICDEEPLD